MTQKYARPLLNFLTTDRPLTRLGAAVRAGVTWNGLIWVAPCLLISVLVTTLAGTVQGTWWGLLDGLDTVREEWLPMYRDAFGHPVAFVLRLRRGRRA